MSTIDATDHSTNEEGNVLVTSPPPQGIDRVVCIICRYVKVYPFPSTIPDRILIPNVLTSGFMMMLGRYGKKPVNVHFCEHERCAMHTSMTREQKVDAVNNAIALVRKDLAQLVFEQSYVLTFSADGSLADGAKLDF